MLTSVDLNADLGESYGRWDAGDDAALMPLLTSANIACGFHAGGPEEMAQAMRRAVDAGVRIGAHPGFADLAHFGRRRLPVSDEEAANLVAYQLGAARAMAAQVGARVRHVKLHGALSNMAAENALLARACLKAALTVDPEIIVVVLPGTELEVAAAELECRVACEIFADRAYEDDGTLVDRRESHAVQHDPEKAASRVLAMLEAQAIISHNGKLIPTRIDTICVHGDTPGAVGLARKLRDRLRAEGVAIQPFEGKPLLDA